MFWGVWQRNSVWGKGVRGKGLGIRGKGLGIRGVGIFILYLRLFWLEFSYEFYKF